MEATEQPDGHVFMRMTHAEALVLFEWLHRHEDVDVRLDQRGLVDAAEREVLWALSCALESLLAEPFLRNYEELLAEARAEVRHGAE